MTPAPPCHSRYLLSDKALPDEACGKGFAPATQYPTTGNALSMTSLPLVLDDDEPIGIILRAGRKMLRPAKIWAYCWFADEADGGAGDHTHRHLPEHID